MSNNPARRMRRAHHQRHGKRMRHLHFTDSPEDRAVFTIIFRGFMLGSDETDRGRTNQERARDVFRKLRRISETYEAPNGKLMQLGNTGDEDRRLVVEPGQTVELALENAEADMVKRHLDNIAWPPAQADAYLTAMDWLDGKQEKPKPDITPAVELADPQRDPAADTPAAG